MKIGERGEDRLIAEIITRLPVGTQTLVGPGDDCAHIAARRGSYVVSTDLLVEGTHFRAEWSSAFDIGARAAAQNLADVAAMGAHPTAMTVGLALPADVEVEWVSELAEGIASRCRPLGVGVVGGDMTTAAHDLTIAVTVMGDPVGAPLRRDGARVGDAVCLAGTLGYSATGLALYTVGRSGDDGDADLTQRQRGLARSCRAIYRAPRPPLEAMIAAAGSLHAAMDVSDGLAKDAARMAAASGACIDLDARLLAPFVNALAPLDDIVGSCAHERVASGGEDHAFLATCDPGEIPAGFTLIGRVKKGPATCTFGGLPHEGAGGWESLRHEGDKGEATS